MPDTRGWLAFALVLLIVMVFAMMAINPEIAKVQLFGVLATAVVSGGFGSVLGFYFGSSKSEPDKTQ